MKTIQDISRRKFIRLSGISGAALTIGFYFPSFAKTGKIISGENADQQGIALTSWVSIDKSGKVTILCHRAEMGQGAFQAIPQMIAEELEVDLNHVSILFAPGDQNKYGSQVTGGSSSVRGAYKILMRTGATAREMLKEAAAKKWNVPVTECRAENGVIYHKGSDRKLMYGDLVEEASKITPPDNVVLK
ncbi:MAG: molybdopterin cofactor-binding domain-containing protein, partial [Flavisolibacter sp.]